MSAATGEYLMKRAKILFVNLPTIPFSDVLSTFKRESIRSQSASMPLGILYLSSSVKQAGVVERVGLVDYVLAFQELDKFRNTDEFISRVAKSSADFTPDIVAFSLIFSSSYEFFVRCLPVLRNMWPKATFIVGGIHATNSVKHLLRLPEIDYIGRGECELALPEFIRQFLQRQEISVQGFYSRANLVDGIATELCIPAFNLDDLPFPDWDLIDMERYVTSIGRQRHLRGLQRYASMMTTRGCYNRCTFCSAHTVHGRKMRYRSEQNVLDEMKALHSRYGVTLFMPEDDLFTANRERVLRLLSEIRNLPITGLEMQFPAALSVNTLDDRVIDALQAAGMKICVLAIESGSKHVQRHVINKNCNLEKARTLVKYAKSTGLFVRCYFIFGFPLETRERMRETIEFAKSLEADWCVFNIATPLVGSEMYDQFVKAGCIRDEPETWSNTIFDRRWFDTDEISAKDLNSLVYQANLECNFLHNPNRVKGDYSKAIRIFEDIAKKHPFHVVAWYCIMECYQEWGRETEAEAVKTLLLDLIKTDSRAGDMYEKYQNLMPRLSSCIQLSSGSSISGGELGRCTV